MIISRDFEKYDIENLMNQNLDYNAAFAMTSELVAMEIINRIFICIFEVSGLTFIISSTF